MATTTISGTTDIEDLKITGDLGEALFTGNENYGGDTELGARQITDEGNSQINRALIRCSQGSIPAGTVTGFRLVLYLNVAIAGTAVAYRVKDNNGWVEGTSTGAAQTGSSCWNKLVYNTTDWVGSAGCGTSGVDYYADASPPSVSTASTGSKTFTLSTGWATDWRGGTVEDNGLLLKSSESGQTGGTFFSTEYTSNQPYWEVDTSGGAATKVFMRSMMQGK